MCRWSIRNRLERGGFSIYTRLLLKSGKIGDISHKGLLFEEPLSFRFSDLAITYILADFKKK